MLQVIVIYLIAAYFLNWWLFEAARWESFVYPNKNDLTIHQNAGVYDTLEACRAASIYRLQTVSSLDKGDFECGLNCEPGGYGLNICEETN